MTTATILTLLLYDKAYEIGNNFNYRVNKRNQPKFSTQLLLQDLDN